jgi:hypothetical protein
METSILNSASVALVVRDDVDLRAVAIEAVLAGVLEPPDAGLSGRCGHHQRLAHEERAGSIRQGGRGRLVGANRDGPVGLLDRLPRRRVARLAPDLDEVWRLGTERWRLERIRTGRRQWQLEVRRRRGPAMDRELARTG